MTNAMQSEYRNQRLDALTESLSNFRMTFDETTLKNRPRRSRRRVPYVHDRPAFAGLSNLREMVTLNCLVATSRSRALALVPSVFYRFCFNVL